MLITADMIVLRGSVRTIACAKCLDGSMPADEFLANLPESDRRKMAHLFLRMTTYGQICNSEKFKRERDRIWAFKTGGIRVACFQNGVVWFLTHGFIKKKGKWPTEQLDRADRIRNEHISVFN